MTENIENGTDNARLEDEVPVEMRIKVGPLMFRLMKDNAGDGERINWKHLETGIGKLIAEKSAVTQTPDDAAPTFEGDPSDHYTQRLLGGIKGKVDGAIDGMGDEIQDFMRNMATTQDARLHAMEGAINALRFMYGVMAATEDDEVRFSIEKANTRIDEILRPIRDPNKYLAEEQVQDLDEDVKQSARAMRSQEGGDGRSTDPQDKEGGERER